jgi:Protein kinase domain/CHASE2 domain
MAAQHSRFVTAARSAPRAGFAKKLNKKLALDHTGSAGLREILARPLRSRYQTAIALGICAAIATYVPPLSLGQRIDLAAYDLWQRLSAGAPDPDIVLVTIDDADSLATLAALAKDANARLVIATTPTPPSAGGERMLGPTQVALGARVLRSTEWPRGGHLWFEPDLDGTVRMEHPVLEDLDPIPSLALASLQTISALHAHGRGEHGAGAADARGTWGTDPRRIRFLDGEAFARVTPADLVASQALLTDRIVLAGHDFPRRDTPVGAMSEHELVANVLSSYRHDAFVTAPWGLAAAAWALTLLTLLGLARKPRWLVRLGWALPVSGTLGLFGISGALLAFASVWMPVTAPAVIFATAGSLIAMHPRRRFRSPRRESTPNLARELFAHGKLTEAWAIYREIPPTKDLLVELYDLAKALEHAGYLELAADVFHRITLVDARFRDAAKLLVTTSHSRSHGSGSVVALQLRGALPDHLGRYELLEPIGQGSAGKVFLGRDPKINRLVAIKVIDLLAEYEPDELEEGKDQFRREAETAGRLNHPDIVTVFDIGETDGLAYIAMEYLKGRHLSDFAHADSLLPTPLVLELGARVADALDYAHSQNVVHRDIKPANIMYDSVSDSLKITDFGIARLIDVSRTRTGIVLGTPSYMAPEQLEGRNVNGHTDLFALGVTIYELLTGRLPFRGASMTKLMFVIANEPHQPMTALRPDLPQPLDALLDTALAKDPADRFQSGAEMAHALREVAAQMG